MKTDAEGIGGARQSVGSDDGADNCPVVANPGQADTDGIHYTFGSQADRGAFYDACAGPASRTLDAHNCPPGATGGGFCRHTTATGDRTSDTYTYNGTASELWSRCELTDGIWM